MTKEPADLFEVEKVLALPGKWTAVKWPKGMVDIVAMTASCPEDSGHVYAAFGRDYNEAVKISPRALYWQEGRKFEIAVARDGRPVTVTFCFYGREEKLSGVGRSPRKAYGTSAWAPTNFDVMATTDMAPAALGWGISPAQKAMAYKALFDQADAQSPSKTKPKTSPVSPLEAARAQRKLLY